MRVRQLIGRYAGQVVDMDPVAAQNCVVAGTAAWPDDPVHVKGLPPLRDEDGDLEQTDASPTPEPEAEPESDPDPEPEPEPEPDPEAAESSDEDDDGAEATEEEERPTTRGRRNTK